MDCQEENHLHDTGRKRATTALSLMAATAVAGADDQVLVALEHDRQREGAESRFSAWCAASTGFSPLATLRDTRWATTSEKAMEK
ncbi:hypothetical protein [Mesorhizobium sp.]|uniref:hypothetical protein n=1 Tax=Mesorhizobium sp. TaxID=1871066 RepID=UPI0025C4D11A|nr:hypothetical protein [Mesorhizobium sp.]